MRITRSSTDWKNASAGTSSGRSEIKPAATLIFTWGNPSRGDDAIGPEIFDILTNEALDDVEVLTDFQLQIEHVIDLENRERILFLDASVSATAPFECHLLQPDQDDSYTTHAMSPQSLLAVYEKVNQQTPPPAYLISIRGYEFGLGKPVSDQARNNIVESITFIKKILSKSDTLP